MRVLVACEYSGRVRDAFTAKGHQAVSCDLLPTETMGIHHQGDVSVLLDGWMPVTCFAMDCDPEGNGGPCQITGECFDYCQCIGPTQEGIDYLETEEGLFGRPIDNPHWDLMIAHPPCTYLTCSAEWAYKDPSEINRKLDPEKLYGDARKQARDAAAEFFMMLVNAPIEKIAIENPVGVMSSRYRKPDCFMQPYEYGHDASKKTALWLKNLAPLKPTEFIEPRYIDGKPRWANQTDSGQNREPPAKDRWKIRSTTWQGWADAMAAQWG